MQRLQLLSLMNGYRDRAGSNDFIIEVTADEARAVNMSLIYFKAEGLIDDYERLDPPQSRFFEIYGFTGYTEE